MDYRYGSKAEEIDEFFRKKRSWSNVKDKIVGDYIQCYLKTIQNLGRRILIVDGFSGPGKFGDDSLGSPLIFCNAIRQTATGKVDIGCLFADIRSGHRVALESALTDHIKSGVSEKPYPDCGSALTRALVVGANCTIFFYLDPYGIKDLDFDMVRQIYERDTKQSTEVLINFNFRAFMRMSGNWSFRDSEDEISAKVKSSKVETVNRVMGGDYWIDIVTNISLDRIAREDAVVEAYMNRVRKFFRYTYSIPVKQVDENEVGIPTDDLARYHLIFGTRHARAVVYMNDVARNALEPYFNKFKDGLLFDMTPERYRPVSVESIKKSIVSAVRDKPLKRSEIYEIVIPQFFLSFRKKEYREMIDDLTFKEGRLYPDRRTMKKKSQLNEETALSSSPWPGELL